LSGKEMDLKGLLEQKKSGILQRWVDLTLETYPPEAQDFLRKQEDPFANPVGSTIRGGLEEIYRELLLGADSQIGPLLEGIVKIRAIQNFSPSVAIAFLPFLKQVIKEGLRKEIQENRLFGELWELEARIDKLTLQAFDLYMGCREKIYQIRIKELKNGSGRFGERMNSLQKT
jgi:hypothetical protein